MDINVYNYKSVLKNHTITSSDRLVFEIAKGYTLVYRIHPTFLDFPKGLNDTIFAELGLDKVSVSKQVYGQCRTGDFPEFENDNERDKMIMFLFDTLATRRGLSPAKSEKKVIPECTPIKLHVPTKMNLSIKL
jgi:hypothetical protein